MKTKTDKSIYIHIGPHKTGTTTIQTGLRLNQDALKKAGYLVPQSGRINDNSAGHHALNKKAPNSERVYLDKNVWKEIESEIQNHPECSHVFLTAELFSFLPYNEIEIFSQLLKAYQVQIITYLRRQDRLIQSLWSQRIKNPKFVLPENFHDYVENKSYMYHDGRFIATRDYLELTKLWGDVFGNENLKIRLLEKESLKGHLFEDFLDACGIEDTSAYKIPPNRNETPGLKALRAMQILKEQLWNTADETTIKFLFKRVNLYADLKNWNTQRLNLIDKETYTSIMSTFERTNKAIAQEYFARDFLFLEPFKEADFTPLVSSVLTEKEFIKIFSFFPSNLVFRPRLLKKIMQTDLDDEGKKKLANELSNLRQSKKWRKVHSIMQKMKKIWLFSNKIP